MKYSLSELKKHVAALGTVHSMTGRATYRIETVTDNRITLQRETTKKTATISTTELYEYYQNAKLYNTTEAKMYISTRAQSPAVAILLALNRRQ